MNRSRPNPLHHNYNRIQPPKTQLAGRLNWLRLQVMGAQGNLAHVGFAVTQHPMFKKLKPEYQERLATALSEMRNIAVQLKDISEEIAALNSPDKWVD